MIAIRSTLFMLYAIVWSCLFAPWVVLFAVLLRGLWGHRAGRLWRLGIQWGVEYILNIRAQVSGLENMPDEACVILSKHQSAWETLFIQDYVPRGRFCVFVLKKELLKVPLVGWGLAANRMIAIDRRAGRAALDEIVRQGKDRLERGFYVVIFPEGTRVAPGQTTRYKGGGAHLACQLGCQVVPVAHNAGEVWPRQAFLKKSGTVQVHIGAPINAQGMSEQELNQQVSQWIEGEMRRMNPERYPNGNHPNQNETQSTRADT